MSTTIIGLILLYVFLSAIIACVSQSLATGFGGAGILFGIFGALYLVAKLGAEYGFFAVVGILALVILIGIFALALADADRADPPPSKIYNKDKQRQYESRIYSSDPREWKPLLRRLERTVNRRDSADCILAVRQLSLLDGDWKYYDINEANSANGVTWIHSGVTGPGAAQNLLDEAIRRHEWIDNCPHGHDVCDVFPLDYDSYKAYCAAVALKYKSWRSSCAGNVYGVDPNKFETEVQYEQAVESRITYLKKFFSYRMASKQAKQSIYTQIDKIDSVWVSLPESLTPQQKAAATYRQLSQEYAGKDYLQGYLDRLGEKCKIEGFSLEDALAENPTLPTTESPEE